MHRLIHETKGRRGSLAGLFALDLLATPVLLLTPLPSLTPGLVLAAAMAVEIGRVVWRTGPHMRQLVIRGTL